MNLSCLYSVFELLTIPIENMDVITFIYILLESKIDCSMYNILNSFEFIKKTIILTKEWCKNFASKVCSVNNLKLKITVNLLKDTPQQL